MHSLSGPTLYHPCHDPRGGVSYVWLWIYHCQGHYSQILCPPPWDQLAKTVFPGSIVAVTGQWRERRKRFDERDLPYFLVADSLAVVTQTHPQDGRPYQPR